MHGLRLRVHHDILNHVNGANWNEGLEKCRKVAPDRQEPHAMEPSLLINVPAETHASFAVLSPHEIHGDEACAD